MADLKSAKVNKKAYKSSLTKFKEKVNLNLEEADYAKLKFFESKIHTFCSELNTVFDAIFSHADDKDIDEFIDEKETLEESLDDIKLNVQRKLLEFESKDKNCDSKENKSCNDSNAKDNSASEFSVNRILLPPLALPHFSGRLEEWTEFHDLFVASVHKNTSLSKAQKLQYLKSSCKADALSVIHSIPISDTNYEIAWNLLVERYSNKKDLINAIIKKLLSLPQINESASSILKFVDSINECIRTLEMLDQKVTEFSDTIVVYILVEKLDKNIRAWWERSLKKDEIGTVDQLTSFLKEHARTLDPNKTCSKENKRTFYTKSFMCSSENSNKCLFCKSEHQLFRCPQFLKLSAKKRFEFVKDKKLCFNCLSCLHLSNHCKSTSTCRRCSKKHNTLIHLDSSNIHNNQMQQDINKSSLSAQAQTFVPAGDTLLLSDATCGGTICSTNTASNPGFQNKQIILSTAIVYVRDKFNQFIPVRAILDTGSENNFISTECLQLLKLKPRKINASVSGLNNAIVKINENIVTSISNSSQSFIHELSFFVVPKITRITPISKLTIASSEFLSTLNLADPEFFKPGPVHMLLSNEIFFKLLKTSQITLENLVFQNTVFGYVASGYTYKPPVTDAVKFCGLVQSEEGLSDIVKKFWEIEGIKESGNIKSKEEEYCEEHFQRTHFRRKDGRYEVEMPIKTNGIELLGDSKEIANKKLNFLVKRLSQNPQMKSLYEDFLQEYNELGHSEVVTDKNEPSYAYYLPHHGIYRPEKLSTVLRVVFNASEATSSGVSLNDILLNGGIVQDELFDIICRFRLFKFAFTADITKMYRQIFIKEEQRDLLRILWKTNEKEPVKVFRMNTITYGTSNAPYLATRTLNQLAEDEKVNFPLAAKVVQKDFYVDDVLSGAQTLAEAQELQRQLKELLSSGGMSLHKWCANHSELLQDSEHEYAFNDSEGDQNVKTLGLLWNTKTDCFMFKTSIKEPNIYTKRTVLSDIARIYDPLGLLGPGITKAKIFIQKLWLLKLEWSDPLPEKVKNEWKVFVTNMQAINHLKINRFVLCDSFSEVELHGFSDASEQAYGAVIYLRSTNSFGTSSNLLCSKSRVAPLKALTIPRLELNAAVLLAQLVSKVSNSLNLRINKIYLWCDSTIVLAWLKKPPHLLKTFVAGRVQKVQELTESCQWNHVSSENNPADLVSRGVNFDSLIDHQFWFHGPSFLVESNIFDSTGKLSIDCSLEQSHEYLIEFKNTDNSKTTLFNVCDSQFFDDILDISNSYIKLIRVTSFIFRFVYNCQNPQGKRNGSLTLSEYQTAEQFLVKSAQIGKFQEEISKLEKGNPVSGKSRLANLNVFLDEEKILRVGGRLSHSDLPYCSKFPAVLPDAHKFTFIILRYFHLKYLHLGSQALLYHVRQRFWPLNGRNNCRKIVHQCLVCSKNNPVMNSQIMADLPRERVTPDFPFNVTGVDFCGPFFVKFRNQRKGVLNKIYVVVYVCLCTKALHLDFVSDLTTQAFIASLKRFFGRRGKCAKIMSDNSKTFIGANIELRKFLKIINSQNEDLSHFLSNEGVIWKFIPPRSPNFGGIWEAGVKSFKFHLKRVVGNQRLTLEEFLTILSEIEGVLNSRPLTPLSPEFDNFETLTPGHFLIGRAITSIVEPRLVDVNENRLSKWQKIAKFSQKIWMLWKRDYLNNLQQRNKWKFHKEEVKEGALVLIKQENLPATKWAVGRIAAIFKGKDKVIRVIDLRLPDGRIIKRNVRDICILPIE